MNGNISTAPSSAAHVKASLPPPPSPYPASTCSIVGQRGTARSRCPSASRASSWSSHRSPRSRPSAGVSSSTGSSGEFHPSLCVSSSSSAFVSGMSAHRSDSGRLELDRAAAQGEAGLTPSRRPTRFSIGHPGLRHQYSIILGSWALSMAAADAIVAKHK